MLNVRERDRQTNEQRETERERRRERENQISISDCFSEMSSQSYLNAIQKEKFVPIQIMCDNLTERSFISMLVIQLQQSMPESKAKLDIQVFQLFISSYQQTD